MALEKKDFEKIGCSCLQCKKELKKSLNQDQFVKLASLRKWINCNCEICRNNLSVNFGNKSFKNLLKWFDSWVGEYSIDCNEEDDPMKFTCTAYPRDDRMYLMKTTWKGRIIDTYGFKWN